MTTDLTIATRLASRSPAETDRLIRSSLQSHGVRLTERIRILGGFTDDSGRSVPTTYVPWFEIGEASADTLRRAVAHHATALHPGEVGQIEMWLAELSVITARRRDDEATEGLRAHAFVSRLMAYPADVARAALLEHRWRFWPTWAELADVCDALVKPRRDLQARLQAQLDAAVKAAAKASAIAAPGQHRETRDERRVSAEAAERIMAETGAGLRAAMMAQEAEDADRRRAAAAETAAIIARSQRQPEAGTGVDQ